MKWVLLVLCILGAIGCFGLAQRDAYHIVDSTITVGDHMSLWDRVVVHGTVDKVLLNALGVAFLLVLFT